MTRVPAYLTHSYRAADRELNEFFWDLLWESGFTCTVDPKSGVLSAPHLERLVKRSACLVGIFTHRPEQPYYGCSPFALYEWGLSVLTQKPRLAFVERGVSGRYFPDGPTVRDFNRRRLKADRAELVEALAELRNSTPLSPQRPRELLGQVGMLWNPASESDDAFRAIREEVFIRGYSPVEVEFSDASNLDLCLALDDFDFVIIDVTPDSLPDWLYPFVHGRAIPSLRLLRLPLNFAPEKLSPLVRGQLLRGVSVIDDPIVIWQTRAEVVEKVERHLLRLPTERDEFQSKADGLAYFRGIGREGRRVFVSNFRDANEFAAKLSAALTDQQIEHFHYKFSNDDIALGSNWQKELEQQVQGSDVFIALMTGGYHHSQWAQQEFDAARQLAKAGNLSIVPYLLDKEVGTDIEQQGRDLSDLDDPDRVDAIVRDVDQLLTGPRPAERVAKGRSRRQPVDVAFITVLPEEYEAVLSHVDRDEDAPSTAKAPNLHAWRLAELDAPSYDRPYRAVVAVAARPGNNYSVLVARNTIERFRPRYVLLVGIAGGLLPLGAVQDAADPDSGSIAPGDVVVSSEIYDYEYGKIDDGFKPRHNFVEPADSAIVTAATVFTIKEPSWHSRIRHDPLVRGRLPRVTVGTVASGNKVVDDPTDQFFRAVHESWPKLAAVEMEGAGAAAAIRNEAASGRTVGFAMIRGISDVPRRSDPTEQAVSQQTAERDAWKRYAAEAAATFATSLVRLSWPVPPRG